MIGPSFLPLTMGVCDKSHVSCDSPDRICPLRTHIESTVRRNSMVQNFTQSKNINHHNMTWASRWINIGAPFGRPNSYPFLKATLYNKLPPSVPHSSRLDIKPKAERLSVAFSTPISLLLFRFLFTFRLLRLSSLPAFRSRSKMVRRIGSLFHLFLPIYFFLQGSRRRTN